MTNLWALSDIHFGIVEQKAPGHLAALQQGVATLLTRQRPDAVLVVGDIVDSVDSQTYAVARVALGRLFPGAPLLPAVGNHEFTDAPTVESALAAFREAWSCATAYRRDIAGLPVLVLDMYPHAANSFAVPESTLAWLEQELATIGSRFCVLAEHCPLTDTVGDRDPAGTGDYSTTNPRHQYFQLANSTVVRALLARQPGSRLLLSGHTHSGWEAPNLVKTEWLGDYPVTFINLMSAYFTGINARHNKPDIVPLWQIETAGEDVTVIVHDLVSGTVLRRWTVPLVAGGAPEHR